MHVFSGKSSASARFKRGEPPPPSPECVGGNERKGEKEQARRPAPIVGAFRSFAPLYIFSLHLPYFPFPELRFHLSLSPSSDFLSTPYDDSSLLIPSSLRRTTLPPFSPVSSSHEWPKKEMCLCLDSRQIICGNKFLCV